MTTQTKSSVSPAAESIHPEEVVKRIVEAREAEAWPALKDTILTPPRHTVPSGTSSDKR